MIHGEVKRLTESLFGGDENHPRRNVYFDRHFSSRNLEDIDIVSELSIAWPDLDVNLGERHKENLFEILLSGQPVLFWDRENDSSWFIIYSSELNKPARNKLQNIADIKGWLIEAWIPGEEIDALYKKYSKEEENVNIRRTWKPYHLYKRDSKVPEEFREYYAEHRREFVEQDIEIDIKTPKWMMDDAISQTMTESLEEKSGTSKTEFTMEAEPSPGGISDGGTAVQQPTTSGVTVRENARITHRSGDLGVTMSLVDESTNPTDELFQEFEDVCGDTSFQRYDDGRVLISNFQAPTIPKFTFSEIDFDEESSIKLSNFLTVGQKDVDLYGIIIERSEKAFLAETYLPFSNDRYKVIFDEYDGSPTLFVRPTSGSKDGLIYLYRKLKEKIHPEIDRDYVDEFPDFEGAI